MVMVVMMVAMARSDAKPHPGHDVVMMMVVVVMMAHTDRDLGKLDVGGRRGREPRIVGFYRLKSICDRIQKIPIACHRG